MERAAPPLCADDWPHQQGQQGLGRGAEITIAAVHGRDGDRRLHRGNVERNQNSLTELVARTLLSGTRANPNPACARRFCAVRLSISVSSASSSPARVSCRTSVCPESRSPGVDGKPIHRSPTNNRVL